MSSIQYVGEHLWIGHLIHAAVIIGFLANINACYAYFKSAKSDSTSFTQYARYAFLIQSVMVWGTMALMFYAMFHHYYEYEYVRHHISDDLQMRYVFAAFWEGQEGSFLLWMSWNSLLGMILMFTSGKWEKPALALLAALQLILFSMLLGVYFGSFKLGASPSLLVRQTFNAPIFENPNYLSLMKSNGLNPLLQNYWMTIHPPTLFLGFASTVVPFLFAFAGWYYRDAKAWLKPAQEWALFSAFILGLGILMGGAWAYEALSFGGYWAWDPVENMSLVPWIIMVAGLHTNLIARSTGRAIGSTYIYYLVSFLLMLYSSYLTRSGVLGDASVHAFSDEGLGWQLITLFVVFTGIGIYQYQKGKSILIRQTEDEKIYSREFWLSIGSMVLLLSATLITVSTSLPVFNKIVKLFDKSYIGQVIVDPISHHNRFQLWIGVLIGLLSGTAELMRFKEIHWQEYKPRFLKLVGISFLASAFIFSFSYRHLESPAWQHLTLLFAGIYSMVSNITYLISFLRGNLKLAGSACAHFGFGMMVVGILATGLNKRIISTNAFAQSDLIQGFKQEDYLKNLVLIKGAPMSIKDFEVTYKSDTLVDPFHRKFDLRFDQKDAQGKTVKSFNATPTLVYSRNESQQPSVNPSIHRTWTKDLYTFVNWLPPVMMNAEVNQKAEEELKYIPHAVNLQDTLFYSSGYGILKSISNATTHPDYEAKPGDLLLNAVMEFHQLNDTNIYLAQTLLVSRGDLYFTLPGAQNELGLKFKIKPETLEQFYPAAEGGRDLILKQGQQSIVDGYKIKFLKFDKTPSEKTFDAKPNDIAVSTPVEVTTPGGKTIPSAPIFVIRNNQIYPLHSYLFSEGIRLTCIKIDPKTESITLKVYKYSIPKSVEIQVAEKAPRNDLIVIQSILFTGINLFWIGSLTMLLGILLSGFMRWKSYTRPV